MQGIYVWGVVGKLKVSISTRQAAVLSLKSALWIWWIFFALQFLKSLISAVEGKWNVEAFSFHSVREVKSQKWGKSEVWNIELSSCCNVGRLRREAEGTKCHQLMSKEGKGARIRDGFPRTNCWSFGFCPNEGGGGPAQIFRHLFISAFLVNKRGLFPP